MATMEQAFIRRADIDDAEVLAHLAEYTFRDAFATENNGSDLDLYCAKNFGPEVQRLEIIGSNSVVLLGEVDGQPVGFAQVLLHAPQASVVADRPSELRRLYVSKKWHGQGVAHKIMSQVLTIASQDNADVIWLGVWEHNPRAIAFYRKYGFEAVGEHDFMFGNELQRDLIMAAKIDESFMA
ncbi:MAG: GNAT family N-acetyltransferase [Cyanobacteria bacterium P01_F01_bin.150]